MADAGGVVEIDTVIVEGVAGEPLGVRLAGVMLHAAWGMLELQFSEIAFVRPIKDVSLRE